MKRTGRGYTYTGLWSVIQRWIDHLAALDRRRARQLAREREEAAARERIRRENRAGRDERLRREKTEPPRP